MTTTLRSIRSKSGQGFFFRDYFLKLGFKIPGMKSGFQFFVYILLCSDGSYYIGVTNDIERRIMEHNEGVDSSSFTYPRRPIELKFLEYYDDVIKAIEREKQLKGWSRKKKEALIEQNIPALKDLSKKIWK